MKRSDALVNLSRDHHQALVVAMHLKRVSESDRESVRQEFVDFWTREGREHFRLEEEILLPALRACEGTPAEVLARVLDEHHEIGTLADQLEGEPDASVESLVKLGEQLSDHVRFEERELFPLVEVLIPPEQLEPLTVKLQGSHKCNAGPNAEDVQKS